MSVLCTPPFEKSLFLVGAYFGVGVYFGKYGTLFFPGEAKGFVVNQSEVANMVQRTPTIPEIMTWVPFLPILSDKISDL